MPERAERAAAASQAALPRTNGAPMVGASVPSQRARLTRIEAAGAREAARILDRAARQSGMDAAPRVRGLLAVINDILADLTMPGVLHRILHSACELVQARYGAIGVLQADGSLAEFITTGIDDEQAAAIGDPPAGHGILGLLISDPRPLRLRDLAADPRSVGFPPGHPPMRSFLGVPIRREGWTYGNLYLAEKTTAAEFTAEDEEFLVALSRAAAVALENARLHQVQERRQEWLTASAEITRTLLTAGADPLPLIAARAREVAHAELARILIPSPNDPDYLLVIAADGVGAAHFVGMLVPKEGSLTGRAFAEQRILTVDYARAAPYVPPGVPLGPTLACRAPSPTLGQPAVLALSRQIDDPRFTSDDQTMVAAFADQAGLALELAEAQRAWHQILLNDRDRIARDLHDQVIQRLFAAGLNLSSLASRSPDRELSRGLDSVTQALDDTIRVLRHSIFDLQRTFAAEGLRSQILRLVRDLSPALGTMPELDLRGPLDATLNAELTTHLLAVVREALTNVARHAHATRVTIRVEITEHRDLVLAVTDDGVGLGASTRRSGLANIQHRARALGGTSTLTSPVPGQQAGTLMEWSVALT